MPFYGVCQAPTKTTHICICLPCETEESAPMCDNNDVTHKNTCEYNYHVRHAQEKPGIKHYGGCKRKSLPVLWGWISCRKISRNQDCLRKINWKITGKFILSSLTASLTREKKQQLFVSRQKQETGNDCDVNSGLHASRKTDFSVIFLL